MNKYYLPGLAVIGLFLAGTLVTGCYNKPRGVSRPEGGVKYHMEAAVMGGGGASASATPPSQADDKAADDKAADDKAADDK
jgi:hypothetical protein